MKLKIVVITAVSLTVSLAAAPVEARSSIDTAQVLETKPCKKCGLIGANVKDARQERQEQRQQRQEIRQERQQQRQEVPQQPQQQPQQQPTPGPEAQQERQEQRQQRQEQRQDARQERQQQLQQQPTLRPEAQQERQEQRQQRQDVRQERQEQRQDARQERQQQLQQQPNLSPEVRQERQQQRQQRQDVRQERQEQRQEQRQDARQEWIRERNTWWLREHDTWVLPGHETGWYEYGEYVYPAQSARSIKVHLISLTKDRVKVLIEGVNGKQEIAFDGIKTRQTVYLSAGTHKLWFKDTADSSWMSGTLNLGRTNLLKIAFDKTKKLVRVYDDHYAWIEERSYPTESFQLNRTHLECPEVANN